MYIILDILIHLEHSSSYICLTSFSFQHIVIANFYYICIPNIIYIYIYSNKGNNKRKLQKGSNNKFKNIVNSSPLHSSNKTIFMFTIIV